jgi:hypothetical protein
VNENCLKDMACPKCKSEGPFGITVSCAAEVHDDGVHSTWNVEWVDGAGCCCKACGYLGEVQDFDTEEEVPA